MVAVSIILPVYNGMLFLSDAVQSVLSQTFRDFELIVINDGSTDCTQQYLESVEDSRLKIVDNTQQGVSRSRNEGLFLASGEYIAFIDADDVFSSTFLYEAVNSIRKNNVDIVCGGVTKKYASKEEDYFNQQISDSIIYKSNDVNKLIFKTLCYYTPFTIDVNPFLLSCLHGKLFKKSVLRDIWFMSDISIGEDSLFVIEAFKRCRSVAFVNRRWYTYRIHETSATGTFRQSSFLNTRKLTEALFVSCSESQYKQYVCIRCLIEFENDVFHLIKHNSTSSMRDKIIILRREMRDIFYKRIFGQINFSTLYSISKKHFLFLLAYKLNFVFVLLYIYLFR